MIRRALIVCVVAIAASASADPAPAPARVVAVVGPDGNADVRTSILIGPSGQVFIGDGAGRWVRRAAGGVAADVSGAARFRADLIVTGSSTPLYRFDGTGWSALKLGQSGKTVLGRGPLPAVVIGRQVFIQRERDPDGRAPWVRVAEAPPGPVTAVWALSARKVFVVTPAGVHALRKKELVRTRDAVDTIVGTTPWGVDARGAIDLATGRQVLAAPGTVAATGGATAPWLLTAAGTAPLRLVGRVATVVRTIDTPIPIGTAIAGLAADGAGHVLVVTVDGQVHLWADDAWTTGTLVEELPVARPGPGPAPTS